MSNTASSPRRFEGLRVLLSVLLFLLVLSAPLFLSGSASAESISLYGVEMDLDTQYIDLRRIGIHDNGDALVEAVPLFENLRYIDLDMCELPEERILEIRDMFPDIQVIWRVTFSGTYSVRTNVKTILASFVADGGLTDEKSCIPLTYCTDVVNLDLGHNNHLTTLDFVRNMPDLEVLIVAKDDIKDISALAECKKLRYLELYKNPDIDDISALAGLTELRDLEIGMLPKLTDLSPIYDLELDRLWIGTQTPIPAEQVEEYARRHPDCVINLVDDRIDDQWRYQEINFPNAPNVYWPQYKELREEIFHYKSELSWSHAENDPYYYMAPGAIPPEVEPVVIEVPPFSMESALEQLSSDSSFLDVTGITSAEVSDLMQALRDNPSVKTVSLGSESVSSLSWEDISSLQEAAPDTDFLYDFTLYGKEFSLNSEVMDLNHITIDDQGALVREVITCMPDLKTLDMDFCGVDDEHMAAIRDDFPDVKVIWRIWFGGAYSVRTDVEKILASSPGTAGHLTVKNAQSLKYCTDVKYLDIGHNEILKDISFVQYMPKLEVAILAMLYMDDISPLRYCPNLEYLEIQTNEITDLSPLSELKNLHHLNIGYNFELTDISPLYGLTGLERLWIGAFTPIPKEQVEEMQRICPDCVINTTVDDPHDGWRYGNERYELLVQQFGYDKAAYSFQWLDPLYNPHY